MPTPATMRVVQMEPGPWPTLMMFAPASARNSTPAAEVTLPASNGRSGKLSRINFTHSPTPRVCPWAVETAIAGIDRGEVRVAEPEGDGWRVNIWVKEAVLLYFPLRDVAGG